MPWLGLVVALVSTIAAIGAWRAAAASNKSAAQLAAIELARRHRELTPQLVASIARSGPFTFRLTLRLDEPLELVALDRVTVSVRNDTLDHSPLIGDVTPEQVSAHIWGPLRFTPRVDGATEDGRQLAPVALKVGDDRIFQMETSPAPVWAGTNGDKWWQNNYQSGRVPVRLAVLCEKDGEDAWLLPLEIPVAGSDFYNLGEWSG